MRCLRKAALSVLLTLTAAAGPAAEIDGVTLGWASSGWKVRPDTPLSVLRGAAVQVGAARGEAEAVQVVLRPAQRLVDLDVEVTDLVGPGGASLAAACVDCLRVATVTVTQPTDATGSTGPWPDPLPVWTEPVTVPAGRNQALWLRVHVPRDAAPGVYRGTVHLRARAWRAALPLHLEVFAFTLPERMTCTTAFGFSPSLVFRYHGLTDPAQKRAVLARYWADFSAHHISPYDPAPLDPLRVTWPALTPPPSPWDDWENLRRVHNEAHGGEACLVVFDDDPRSNVTVTYRPAIPIPPAGLRVRFWFRTALPDQAFNVALNHYDANDRWLSGRNRDLTLAGDGRWQCFDQMLTDFPAGARSVRLHARATPWTEDGAGVGLVWFDDLSVTDPATGRDHVRHGDFEDVPRTEPVAPPAQLQARFDFSAWDRALEEAFSVYHFNSLRLNVPGLGGGTFHSRSEPRLLGFGEDSPEYRLLFDSYCRQLEAHLAARAWLDEAYVYWFDEPDTKDYDYVNRGFAKLHAAAPRLRGMLTVMKGLDARLYGGPTIWCSLTNRYDAARAAARREAGDIFWWYVCTGPQAPYCTLFIDHPGPELRVWLWQTWQRRIRGVLVWQTNYWTSDTAYPEAPQNPYTDPMSWRSGYGTPRGQKRPWGNGDGRFLYPPRAAAEGRPAAPVLAGPVDSIRWEMLRDGIEDYEYFCLLERCLAKRGADLPPARRRAYEALLAVPAGVTTDLTHFTRDPAPLEAHRVRLARAIAELVAP